MTANALYTLIVQAANTAVGLGNVPPNVYPTMPPQGIKLSVSYLFAGGTSSPTLDTVGVQRRRVQIDVRSNQSALEAWTLRDGLVDYLNGYKDVLSDGTEVTVSLIQPLDAFENDAQRYRSGAEFYFTYC